MKVGKQSCHKKIDILSIKKLGSICKNFCLWKKDWLILFPEPWWDLSYFRSHIPPYLHFLMVRPDLREKIITGLSVHLLQGICMHAILFKLGDNFLKGLLPRAEDENPCVHKLNVTSNGCLSYGATTDSRIRIAVSEQFLLLLDVHQIEKCLEFSSKTTYWNSKKMVGVVWKFKSPNFYFMVKRPKLVKKIGWNLKVDSKYSIHTRS